MLPEAEGRWQHLQARGHSFSLYGPPSRQITHMDWTGHCPEWSRICVFAVFAFFSRVINLLLTKLALDRTGRISALGLFCTDRVQWGPYCQDVGPIFSQYGPRAWLIRHIYILLVEEKHCQSIVARFPRAQHSAERYTEIHINPNHLIRKPRALAASFLNSDLYNSKIFRGFSDLCKPCRSFSH